MFRPKNPGIRGLDCRFECLESRTLLHSGPGLEQHQEAAETAELLAEPVIIDFGGAPQGTPVAGMDQWLERQGHPVPQPAVTGAKRVMVLRVYFQDRPADSRYTQAEVEGFFDNLNQLFKDTSYDQISIDYQVSSLFQLPDNRSEYIDDGDGIDGNGTPPCDDDSSGDLSCGDKFDKVLTDSIANSPTDEGLDWSNLDAIMVVMAETRNTEFHRGQGTGSRNLPQGPGGPTENVGAAIFSENPTENDNQVWGRWGHEIGHAFQENGPAHPSNYRNEFELMDSNYPGQTGVFEKQDHMAFPGWMPPAKYQEFRRSGGGGTANLWAMEYKPAGLPNAQAAKVIVTDDLYYLVSVRRRVLGDDTNGDFAPFGIPDEGVLIERVVEGADQWVTVQAPPGGDRNDLWQAGQIFQNDVDGVQIAVAQKIDPAGDHYAVRIAFDKKANSPDVAMEPWTSPPGNTWETTDIWIDNPLNGYGTYRYGTWNDLSGNEVPRGNGDDPAIGQVNRVYARVRNLGDAVATDVKVNFEITDPLGVGIAGANGWVPLGSTDKNTFPSLAAINPGDFVDVYIEWTPDFEIPTDDLEDGRFYFHSCIRVKLDPVAGETVLDNQDGDREQENIDYFQVAEESGSVEGLSFTGRIRLRNDDFEKRKFFYLSYETDVPPSWKVVVNEGKLGVMLEPNEVREIPVLIEPHGPAVVGSVFGVDVTASSQRELVSDLNPEDTHLEFDPLGGARVESRVLERAKLDECNVQSDAGGRIVVTGTIKSPNFARLWDQKKPPNIMMQGRDFRGNVLVNTTTVTPVMRDGTFGAVLNATGANPPAEVVVMFAGTETLTSAGCGPLIVRGGSIHGTKFDDLNGNGRRDRGEPGLAGWTIFLDKDRDGQLDRGEVATTTMADDPRTPADESGMYWFDVPAGSHVVAELPSASWQQTSPNVGVAAPLGFITVNLGQPAQLLQLVPPDTTIAGREIRGAMALHLAWDHNDDTLYTISASPEPDTLAVVDPNTGIAKLIGNGLDTKNSGGLSVDSTNDTIFVVDLDRDVLLQVDPATGQAKPVGRGLGFSDVETLAYDPNGDRLLGIDSRTSQLLLVDRTTGAARAIGKLDINPADLAYDPIADTLYAMVQERAAGMVYAIDTTTARTRRVAGPFKVAATNALEILPRIGAHVVTVSPGERVEGQDFGNARKPIPPARIEPVIPDPRSRAVDRITIAFREPFDLQISDLRLVRATDQSADVPLDSVTLVTKDQQTWSVQQLTKLTFDSGIYTFSVSNATDSWINRPGDVNLDNAFNPSDLIHVFQIGEYEDAIAKNSTWSDGDWNGDAEFDTADLVTAFQGGGYLAAATANALSDVRNELAGVAAQARVPRDTGLVSPQAPTRIRVSGTKSPRPATPLRSALLPEFAPDLIDRILDRHVYEQIASDSLLEDDPLRDLAPNGNWPKWRTE